jgi:hypothetical protein
VATAEQRPNRYALPAALVGALRPAELCVVSGLSWEVQRDSRLTVARWGGASS